jgi:cytochrome c-type biogenesis protein CcmH
MITFYIAAIVLVLLVLVALFRPFFWKTTVYHASRQQLNAAIYKEEIAKLEKERTEGLIDGVTYEISHAEMRQRLFQDTSEDDGVATLGSPMKTIIALTIFIPVIASAMYFWLGSAQQIANGGAKQQIAQQDVEKMVTGLAAKMEKDPSNLKGWAILARSYKVMGRPKDAEKAYDRAGSYLDGDAQLLADYADVSASNANGSFEGKPQRIINRALRADPNNMMALWLAGTADYNRGDYKGAVQLWDRLAKLLPADSEDMRMIKGAILEARGKANLPPEPLLSQAVVPVAAITGKNISGVVEMNPNFKSRVKPDYIVMVIARAPGARMPVAIMQSKAANLPLHFVLNDALAMTPNALISNLSEVTIEVRISKSGQAKAEPGDLYSEMQTVKVGTNNLKVMVDQVRP